MEQLFTLQRLDFDVSEIRTYFASLPADQYTPGGYRTRRFDCFKLSTAGLIKLPHQDFYQSSDYNPKLGGIVRSYQPLADELTGLASFAQLLQTFARLSALRGEAVEIGVHQLEISCSEGHLGYPAPEGIHQDGFQVIGIYVVGVDNLQGGETLLYREKHGRPILRWTLNPGELLVINDRELFHYTSPIRVQQPGRGVRDAFVFTANALAGGQYSTAA
ncbi:2OG-Fe dioxygenase family protein [Gloeobacter violaceus]|uniref:Glr2602 protein n=1 Tax=Gloeobacter violaceus (strain ATCC 29082 / PCC 7421) TaxID=251221 RepID=Q7NHD5_GLOVI|nr:2OG-Fe dioxygenase family protein [Gloeobacter violaceus]BAC90543.1 glr2602 [Gloeobacter violaceus PCC 7421]